MMTGTCTTQTHQILKIQSLKRKQRASLGSGTSGGHDSGLTCMMTVSEAPCVCTSWKFLTEASLTRPRKLRHQQRSVSFQWGALFISCSGGSCFWGNQLNWLPGPGLQQGRSHAQGG